VKVEPSDVLLRLEPSAHMISMQSRDVRPVAAVELHWRDGRRWRRKTFVHGDGTGGLAPVLRDIADWLEACPSLEQALEELGR